MVRVPLLTDCQAGRKVHWPGHPIPEMENKSDFSALELSSLAGYDVRMDSYLRLGKVECDKFDLERPRSASPEVAVADVIPDSNTQCERPECDRNYSRHIRE